MPVTTATDLEHGLVAASQVAAPTVVQLVGSVSIVGVLDNWPSPGIQLPPSMLRLTVQGPDTEYGVLDLHMAGTGSLLQVRIG